MRKGLSKAYEGGCAADRLGQTRRPVLLSYPLGLQDCQ